MKILYFGVFERPYDTEVYVTETLRSMGHTVITRQVNTIDIGKLEKLLLEDYDFIMLSKSWFKGNVAECTLLINQTPTMRVGWFWDLCWGTPREKLIRDHPLFTSQLVFTTDGGSDEKWARCNINHGVIRQGIYEPEAVIGKPKKKYKYDVVFVGTDVHKAAFGWPHRTELLNFLQKVYNQRFKHFGKAEEIRNLELNDLYASAKVVVGDTVVRPNYWSNRIYETTGRGGFLIFPDVPGLEKEFERYKHFIPYEIRDWNTLRYKIDYFLEHDDEREKIKMAGFEHCKKHHTYRNRCEELIKRVYEYKHSSPKLVYPQIKE